MSKTNDRGQSHAGLLKRHLKTLSVCILVALMLVQQLPLSANAAVTSASSSPLATLGFVPTDTVLDPAKPVLYMTDMAGKKLYSLNYETKQLNSIQLDLPPERMAYADGKLYVTLLISGHQYYAEPPVQGAIAIVDTATFTLADEFKIDNDPYDVVVDHDGYIYILPGSDRNNVIDSYAPTTHTKVATWQWSEITTRSFAELHPTQNKIITVNTNISPRDMQWQDVSAGNFVTGKDSPYHGDYEMATNFRLSPDGNYVFNGSGEIFDTNLNHVTSLGMQFADVAFDLGNNMFYLGNLTGTGVSLFDYGTQSNRVFTQIGKLPTMGTVKNLFYQNGNLVVLSKNTTGQFMVELIRTTRGTPSAGANKISVQRLAGNNRTLTAIAVAEQGWPNGADTVVLTRDDDFPDALAGAPLARMNNAPILLTNSQTLSPETAQEITKLHPTKIIILGGEGVVSAAIKSTLDPTYQTERIAGKDRFDTAAQIAQRVGNASGKVVIAYGMDYPDALAVSPWAAKNGVPILLSLTDSLPAFTDGALQQLKPSQTVVVGGSGVVSDAVMSTLPSAKRYAGANRYETAADICNNLGASDGTKLDPSNVFVATGLNWPDALGGAALAGKNGNPIILAGSTLDPKEADYIYSNYATVTKLTPLGGDGVVSADVANEIVYGCYNAYLKKTYGGHSFGGTQLNWLDSALLNSTGPTGNPALGIAVVCDKATWDTIKSNNQAGLQSYLTNIVTDAEKQFPNLSKSIILGIYNQDGTLRAIAYDVYGPVVIQFDTDNSQSVTATAAAAGLYGLK